MRIAVVGKYTEMRDTYMSVIKALQHSAVEAEVNLEIRMIEADSLYKSDSSHSTVLDYEGDSWQFIKAS